MKIRSLLRRIFGADLDDDRLRAMLDDRVMPLGPIEIGLVDPDGREVVYPGYKRQFVPPRREWWRVSPGDEFGELRFTLAKEVVFPRTPRDIDALSFRLYFGYAGCRCFTAGDFDSGVLRAPKGFNPAVVAIAVTVENWRREEDGR